MSNNYLQSNTMPPREVMKGHFTMLFANIVWGLISPVAKIILNDGTVSPLALATVRICGATFLFWLCSLLLPRSLTHSEPIARRDMFSIFIASLLMITSNQAVYIVGVGYTSPIDSAVIAATTPIFTMILAAIFIGERITPLKSLGVALGLGGALLLLFGGMGVITRNASNPLLGNLLCLVAQVSAAAYYVFFSGIVNRYSPFTLMKWMFLFSSITIVPFTATEMAAIDWSAVPSMVYGSMAFIILLPTFLSYLLIPYALRRLKPTLLSMYNYLQPVTSAFYSMAIGLAAFTSDKLIATALIFLGVWVVTQSRNTQSWASLLRIFKR